MGFGRAWAERAERRLQSTKTQCRTQRITRSLERGDSIPVASRAASLPALSDAQPVTSHALQHALPPPPHIPRPPFALPVSSPTGCAGATRLPACIGHAALIPDCPSSAPYEARRDIVLASPQQSGSPSISLARRPPLRSHSPAMAEQRLDQLVKGAPPPDVSVPQVAAAAVARDTNGNAKQASAMYESKKPSSSSPTSDPLSQLPSSPPQIYLNLLILEASLRSQYLSLRARRRLHTFFLILLAAWVGFFFYLLFARPREDGKGVGGSPYWVIDMGEKVGFMGGILTALLVWATGQWERGVRWPRRWVTVTNRGLRGMNLKIVVLKASWFKRILTWPSFLFPYSSFFPSQGSAFHYVDVPEKKSLSTSKFAYRTGHQFPGVRVEDLANGGDHVKLLLLPKPFSPEFRENWELYRQAYWEEENERRAELRKIVKARRRETARQYGGWRWYLGYWRISRTTNSIDVEKMQRMSAASHLRPESSRKRRTSLLDSAPHSRSSSRSSTIGPDLEELRSMDRSHRRHRSSVSSKSGLRAGPRPRPLEGPDDTQRLSTVSNASSASESDTSSAAGRSNEGTGPVTRSSRGHRRSASQEST